MNSIRKKPWNRVDQPIYSVSSRLGNQMNMNICSYVTPVSMKPKRYIVALYKNTLTLSLVRESNEMLLQFLSQHQYKLVPLLGKKSGLTINKLEKVKDKIEYFENYPFLASCNAIVKLSCIEWIDGGDHWCALCDVTAHKNLNQFPPLTLEHLRSKKIISA